MNDNIKPKKKFNIIDVIIIAVIILSILSVVFRSKLMDDLALIIEEDKCEITFVAEGVSRECVQIIKSNDVFYLGTEELGTPDGFSYEYQTVSIEAEDGSILDAKDPMNFVITITFTADGINNEDGFYLGGDTYLGAGKTVTVRSGNLILETKIVSIEPISD